MSRQHHTEQRIDRTAVMVLGGLSVLVLLAVALPFVFHMVGAAHLLAEVLGGGR